MEVEGHIFCLGATSIVKSHIEIKATNGVIKTETKSISKKQQLWF